MPPGEGFGEVENLTGFQNLSGFNAFQAKRNLQFCFKQG